MILRNVGDLYGEGSWWMGKKSLGHMDVWQTGRPTGQWIDLFTKSPIIQWVDRLANGSVSQ